MSETRKTPSELKTTIAAAVGVEKEKQVREAVSKASGSRKDKRREPGKQRPTGAPPSDAAARRPMESERPPRKPKQPRRDQEEPSAPAAIERTLELFLVYKGLLITRHGVVMEPTLDKSLAIFPGAFWAEISLEEHERYGISTNELISRIVYIKPQPLHSTVVGGFNDMFVERGFLQTLPGYGSPMISILGAGKSLKTTVLARMWRKIGGLWISASEPVFPSQVSHICRVVGTLRFAHLTGRIAFLDGLRALLLGPGGLRKAGVRAEAVLDFSALAAACGNAIATVVPPLDSDQLRALDGDMETANQVQLTAFDQANINVDANQASVTYSARGRAAADREINSTMDIKIDELDWALANAIQLLPPSSKWRGQGLELYNKVLPLARAFFEARYNPPAPPSWSRTSIGPVPPIKYPPLTLTDIGL